jgi:hypothetical protein
MALTSAGAIQDEVDGLGISVHDTNNTGREAGILGQLGEYHGCSGVTLEGFITVLS